MKKLTPNQVQHKIQRYCAYQERSHQEVKNKLFQIGVPGYSIDEIISGLIVEGFLNEERFAKAYAGGKFRIKKWGRLKIVHALEKKGLTKNCIRLGLKEIDCVQYKETLTALVQEKRVRLEEENIYVMRDLISKYVIQKGYEPELVWEVLKEIIPVSNV